MIFRWALPVSNPSTFPKKMRKNRKNLRNSTFWTILATVSGLDLVLLIIAKNKLSLLKSLWKAEKFRNKRRNRKTNKKKTAKITTKISVNILPERLLEPFTVSNMLTRLWNFVVKMKICIRTPLNILLEIWKKLVD